MSDDDGAIQYLDFSLLPNETNDDVYLGFVLGNIPISVEPGETLFIPLGEVTEVAQEFFTKLAYATHSAAVIRQDMTEYPDLTAREAIERYQVRISASFN